MQKIATAGIVGTLAAAIRALLTKNEPLMQRLKVFTAGVLMGLLLAIILMDVPLKDFWKEIIIAASTAFVSSIFPMLENFVLRYIKKKGNDIVKDADSN